MSKEVFISDAVSSIILDVGRDVNRQICEEIEEEMGRELKNRQKPKLFKDGSAFLIQRLEFVKVVVHECVVDSYEFFYGTVRNMPSELLYSRFLQLSSEASVSAIYIMFGVRMKAAMIRGSGIVVQA